MSFEVRVPKSVSKQIRKFPKHDWEKIIEVLHGLASDPWTGDIAKVDQKENLWRRRIGNYRLFYSVRIDLKVIEIKKIKRRTTTTY